MPKLCSQDTKSYKAFMDSGTLELLRGLLGSGDKVLQTVAEATRIAGGGSRIRIFWSARSSGRSIPSVFEGFVNALPRPCKRPRNREKKPPGLLSTLNKFRNPTSFAGSSWSTACLSSGGREFFSAANPQEKK